MGIVISDSGSKHVFVIGAGVGGLTAAFRLRQAGLDVTVLERCDHAGGRMETLSRLGFVIDTMAMLLVGTYTEMRRLIEDVGISSQVYSGTRLTGVFSEGQILRTSTASRFALLRLGIFEEDDLDALGRLFADAERAHQLCGWADLRDLATLDLEDAHAYSRRCLTEKIFDYIVEPLCSGVFYADAKDVTAVDVWFSVKRFIGDATFFGSPSGVAFLPRALARGLDVRYEATVTGVHEDPDSVVVEWTDSDGDHAQRGIAAVLAIPGHDVVKVHPALSPAQRDLLSGLHSSANIAVHFGLARVPEEPTAWLLIPRSQHPHLASIMLQHNMMHGRAPEGMSIISTHWQEEWSVRYQNSAEDEIVRAALQGVEDIFPGTSSAVVMHHVVRRRPRCTVTHTPGTYARLAHEFGDAFDQSRIVLAGDHFSITSTNTSVASGERAATRVLKLGGNVRAT